MITPRLVLPAQRPQIPTCPLCGVRKCAWSTAAGKIYIKLSCRACYESVPLTPEERFWSYAVKGEGCWEWVGPKHERGYGQFCSGKKYSAHRFSYELHKGPIPHGLSVCHSCDNPPCTNPAHLFVGTHQDNMADAAAKGRLVGRPRNSGVTKGEMAYTLRCEGLKWWEIDSKLNWAPDTACAMARYYAVSRGLVWPC
jgi:hypothetical protein